MSPAVTKPAEQMTKRILDPVDVSIAPDGRFLLYRTSNGELAKLSLPDGNVQRLPFRLPRYVDFASEGISRDGKELAYIETVTSGKVVLVENPFIWK